MDPENFGEEGRLLVVDDDKNIIKSYKRLFFDSPYQIEYAGGGQEAVKLARSFKPHIVLLDIMMPDIDGYEVCEQIMGDPEINEAEIIFISAKAEDADRLKAYQLGADDFVSKPINPDELLSKIAAKMRRRQSYLNKSMIDPLTGLGNRRHFDRSLEQYFKMSSLYGKSLAITVIDIDFFKKINDTYGHDIGDVVLTGLSAVLKQSLRKKDTIARFGGEEFVMLMPGLGREDVVTVLDRLRQKIEDTPFACPGDQPPISITVSMGVALFPQDAENPEGLFKVADQNLYRAKENGRNRVETT